MENEGRCGEGGGMWRGRIWWVSDWGWGGVRDGVSSGSEVGGRGAGYANKEEEKRSAVEQCGLKSAIEIPICDDDDDNDYPIAITPFYQPGGDACKTLIMENEAFDTISARNRTKFIKV
ncbi:hypothetical protein Tco_0261433 [Tanacetum coccineum]